MPREIEVVYLYSFFNLGSKWGRSWASRLGRFNPPKLYPVSIVQDDGLAPQTVAENVDPPPHRDQNLCPEDGAVVFEIVVK